MQKMITNPILAALKKTPYASTDGTPRDEKKVIARYFLPGTGCTWYVLEDDSFFADEAKTQPEENMVVFGAATLGYGLELGSISLKEIFETRGPFGLRAERDISVKPLEETLGTLRKRYCEEWH
ncbi:MAG: DUF2958 domain-containing protein [Clostridia bacterium]|nr:DUF2958 domain-containing protein [Clostridia bacterium]